MLKRLIFACIIMLSMSNCEAVPLATSNPLMDASCTQFAIESTTKIDSAGKLILEPLETDKDPFILELATGEHEYLPNSEGNNLSEITVSPDYRWVAYFTKPENDYDAFFKLIVSNTKGEIVYQRPIDRTKDWYAIDSWLNNHEMILERYQIDPVAETQDTPAPVTIFNPFTNEGKDMIPDLPDMIPFFDPLQYWDDFGKSGMAYNPLMDFVAYPRLTRDGVQSIVLWDVNEKKEIAVVQATIGFSNGPIWSPEGSQFVVATLAKIPVPGNWTEDERMSEELISISKDGTIKRLTHLTDQFQHVDIEGYRWSPDGKKIAFWVFVESIDDSSSGSDYNLAILDLRSQKITIFCFSGIPGISRLYWSPDGKQILTREIVDKNPKTNALIYDTVLINLAKKTMLKVAEATIPLGWMLDP